MRYGLPTNRASPPIKLPALVPSGPRGQTSGLVRPRVRPLTAVRTAEGRIGAQVRLLEVPPWVPVSRCAQHFEDSPGTDQRDDQVIFLRWHRSASGPVGGQELCHGPLMESIAIRAERPQAAGQIPHLPVDVGFLSVEYGAHPTPVNQDVAFEDVVVVEAGDWSSLALEPGDQPLQVGAGLGDDGAPRCEGRWDSAQWRQRLL